MAKTVNIKKSKREAKKKEYNTKENLKLYSMEHQFNLFLKVFGLDINKMSEAEINERKKTYFAAFAAATQLQISIAPQLPLPVHVEHSKKLYNEIDGFWREQQEKQKNATSK